MLAPPPAESADALPRAHTLWFSPAIIFDDQLLVDPLLGILAPRQRYNLAGQVCGVEPQPVGNISAVEIAAVHQILKVGAAAAFRPYGDLLSDFDGVRWNIRLAAVHRNMA